MVDVDVVAVAVVAVAVEWEKGQQKESARKVDCLLFAV